jgi:hypothetical protein
MAMAKTKEEKEEVVRITPPNFQRIKLSLEGMAPLLIGRFSPISLEKMKKKHEAGSTSKKGEKKAPRDFDADFKQAAHISTEGWYGVPAGALRNSCIAACRMVDFRMTHARMSIFFEMDGTSIDGQPLIKIIGGVPEKSEMAVRNANGSCDIRVRAIWRTWKINVIVRYDADQFTSEEVVNLIARTGEQVGICQGRPFSKSSNGIGCGTFRILEGK